MLRLMTVLLEQMGKSGWKLGVNNPALDECWSGCGDSPRKNGVVALRGGILEAGVNIRWFQIGEVSQNFLLRHTGGEHIEYILDTDTHPANAGASAALGRIDGDAIKVIHTDNI